MPKAARLALIILFLFSVAMGVAVLGGVDFGPDNSSQTQEGGHGKDGRNPPSGELARVFSTHAEAGMADSDHLGSVLVSSRRDVTMVGFSKCDELYVVVIGVSKRQAELPARGPQGTPVIAFLQSGFRAGN